MITPESHQILLTCGPDTRPFRSGLALLLSCTCCPATRQGPNRGGRPGHEPIAAASPFPAADAIAAWRAWHAERGIEL